MFYLKGLVNKRKCSFKVDTGSDVTLIKSDFVDLTKRRVSIKTVLNLRYPTGEKVPVKEKVEILVEIGKFTVKLFAYVADMVEDCLLGVDFLSKVKFKTIFNFFFENSPCEKKSLICSRIDKSIEVIPSFLKELFENET
jgi:predicted aspartyl protease